MSITTGAIGEGARLPTFLMIAEMRTLRVLHAFTSVEEEVQ
jgi:hypothetical protein